MKVAIDLIEEEIVRIRKEVEHLRGYLTRLDGAKDYGIKFGFDRPHLEGQISAVIDDVVACTDQLTQLKLAQIKLRAGAVSMKTFRDGYEACTRDLPWTDNPYIAQSESYLLWCKGYQQCLADGVDQE